MMIVVTVVVIVIASGVCADSDSKMLNQIPLNDKIKQIVTVMLENRSFSNMLGWLKRLNSEIDGLTGDEYNLFNTSDPSSKRVYVHDDQPYVVRRDLGHSISTCREQVFGQPGMAEPDPLPEPAPMNGFVQNYLRVGGDPLECMGAFNPDDVPIHTALAMEFAVFDRWFCSVPGNTMPNRAYLHAATSEGMAYNDVPTLIRGHSSRTIYESLADDGFNWVNYFQEVPSTFVHKYPRQQAANRNEHFRHFSRFLTDARDGLLPPYSYLDPRYFDFPGAPQNDNHPSNADVANGEVLLKEVYEALRASPQWNSTLLIITYDEHGGFFDPVPTPYNVPNPDGIIHPDFDFDRLGFLSFIYSNLSLSLLCFLN